ncbi:MAG: hypothetical protein ACYSVY_23425, partial [Planctomycetota bacterium]
MRQLSISVLFAAAGLLLIAGADLLPVTDAVAGVPSLVTYQGILTDAAGVPLDGVFDLTFNVYPDSLPSTPSDWQEQHLGVLVEDGLFNLILGSVVPMPDTLFEVEERWLGISVNTDPEIYPRLRITAVAYALRAAVADSVAGGGSGGADDDWIINGSDQYSGVPGNVGIGTTSPSRKLEVVGEGVFDGALYARDGTGIGLRDDAGNLGVWVRDGGHVGLGGTPYWYSIFPGQGWGPDVHINTGQDTTTVWIGGDVGEAGVEMAKLEFVGHGDWLMPTGPTHYCGISGLMVSTGGGSTPPRGDLLFYTATGVPPMGSPYAEQMRIRYNGRVGIGTASPLERLDVDGALRLGTTSNTNVGTIRWTGTDFQGYDGVDWKSLTAGAAGTDGDWVMAGDDLYSNLPGNVGIGVTNPSEKLEVYGKLKFSEGSYTTSIYNSGGGLTIDSSYPSVATTFRLLPFEDDIWFQNTQTSGRIYFAGPAGVDLNGDVIFKTTGRVGIGTSNPTAKLHVTGTPGVDGIRFPDGTLQTTASTGGGSGDGHSLDAADGNPINVVFVDNAGEVGIGTTSPTAKLHVAGTPGVDGIKFPDGTLQTTAATGGGGGGIGGGGTQNYVPLFVGPTTLGDSAIYQSGGNVGVGATAAPANRLDVEGAAAIGTGYSETSTAPSNGLIVQGNVGVATATPDYTLDVNGTIGLNDFLYHNGDEDTYLKFVANRIYTVAGSTGLITAEGNVPKKVTVNESNEDVDFVVEAIGEASALFVRGSDGNVGIGTANPGRELDVNGTIRADVLEINGGSDLAEPFVMSDEQVQPGAVVVIDAAKPGNLKRSSGSYDKKVAGV